MTDASRGARPALGRSLLLQAGGFALGLGIHMLLSRWLGSDAYGDLSATLSVALLLATLALFGFDRSASHTLARYGSEGAGAEATSFARFALVRVGTGALVASLLIWGGTRLVELGLGVDQHPIRHAATLILPMAVATLLGSMLTGLQRPLVSQVLGPLVSRLVLLAGVASVLLASVASSEHLAVGLMAIASLSSVVLLGSFLWHIWPDDWAPTELAPQESRSWLTTARSYLVATLPLVGLEESGILLMELLHADEAAVGVYAAAHRTAGLPLIALAAARQLAVPDLAAALKESAATFETRLRPYLRFVVGLGVLIWACFVIFGDPLLSLFGHATEQGHLILVLLGGGYSIFLVAGLAAPVLQLHGDHKPVIRAMLTLFVLSIILGAVVIPFWGGEGLAASYALLIFLVLGRLILQVHRRTGVRYLSLLLPDRGAD